MNILHVIANLAPRYGGPAQACFEMARAVTELGHQVSIITTNQDGPTELDVPTDHAIQKDGVTIHYHPIQHPRFWGLSRPMVQNLRQLIPKSDVVEIHSLYLFHNLVAGHLCRRFQTPYIMRPHGTLDPFIWKRHRLRKHLLELAYENRNIKSASFIRFTTKEEEELAKPHTQNTSTTVVPLGVRTKDFISPIPENSFRNKHPEIGNRKILLFFGRINYKKGLDILIPAFAELCKKRTDAHLVIAGPDNDGYGRQVKKWVSEHQIDDRTTFCKMLLGQDKYAVLREADLFVLPSRTENFGIAVVEAMASRLPVLISKEVNIASEVHRANAGEVLPLDTMAFSNAMHNLLANQQNLCQLADNGYQLVLNQYDWSVIAKQLVQLYQSAQKQDNAD